MKKSDVEIGRVYSAKVGGSYLPMRLDRTMGKTCYGGINMLTGGLVRAKRADIHGTGQTEEEWRVTRKNGEVAAQEAATTAQDGPGSTTAKRSSHGPARPAKRSTGEPGATSRGPSGLDAAATVLAEAGGPLGTKEMVERMLAKGLWTTGGKTPASTIYAAILRECATKGAQARFRKAARGKFELAAARKESKSPALTI